MFKADVIKEDRPVWFWIVAIIWTITATVVGGVILGALLDSLGFGNVSQAYRVALVLSAAVSICWFGTRKGLYFPPII